MGLLRFWSWLLGPSASQSGDPSKVRRFLAALADVAPPAGEGTYAFRNEAGHVHGWVQFTPHTPLSLKLHRIWSHEPGKGSGTQILRRTCDLADEHGIAIHLKVVPIGRKPYPLSRQKLWEWYRRHGFEGTIKGMVRTPRSASVEMAPGT